MKIKLFSLFFCSVFFLIFNAIPISAQIIESEPSGAKVYYDGSYLGKTPLSLWNYDFDLAYKIRRDQIEDITKPPYVYVFTLKMDGYEDQTVRIVGEWRYISTYRDIDCVAGVKTKKVTAKMEKKDTPEVAEEIPNIHWNIVSEPSGARVFWKVTSSIPSIVKSTDFLYLGSTPICTDKPLNIKGLTGANAAQVKIEILIQSKGYKTETKSFSAELLTEQNEISWFFELTEE